MDDTNGHMIHYGTYINKVQCRGVPHRTGKYLDMIVCTHCGKEIAEPRTSCPSCGTSLAGTQVNPGTEAMTGPILPVGKSAKPSPFDSLYEEYIPQLGPIYDRNYAARPVHRADTTSQKAPVGEQEKAYEATPIDIPPDVPAPLTFRERFFPINTKRSLLLEVLLSLCVGIFGIGWLLIGKKRAGTFLLVTSLIFYVPLLIISYALAYFSYGLSILCTGPFVMGAVVLNAFMLHKTTQYKIRERSLSS